MEKLNQWMTLIANVGVVAGIVFLAFEISQNTEQMMSTSIQNLSERMENRNILLATNNQLSEVIRKLYFDEASLTDTEQGQVFWWVASWTTDFEEAYRQFGLGALPEGALYSRIRNMQGLMETNAGKAAWAQLAPVADPSFVEWAEPQLDLKSQEGPSQ